MRPILVFFSQIIINFSYPTPFELLFIYGNANWHVDRAFVEINVSARANANKLAFFSKSYWIAPWWTSATMLFKPVVKPDVFLLFFDLGSDLPIRLKISTWVPLSNVFGKSCIKLLANTIYNVLLLLLRYSYISITLLSFALTHIFKFAQIINSNFGANNLNDFLNQTMLCLNCIYLYTL